MRSESKMLCPYCGKEIPKSNNYCYYCGKSMKTIKEVYALRERTDEVISNSFIMNCSSDVRDDLVNIRSTIIDILSIVEEDIGQADNAHKFLSYYLPETLNVISNYKSLCNVGQLEKEELIVKEEIETSFGTIKTAFLRIYKRLTMDDMIGLSADITTLQGVLFRDGLTDTSDFEL